MSDRRTGDADRRANGGGSKPGVADRRDPERDRRDGERRVDNPSRTFYRDVPPFDRFEDFSDLSHYRTLPDDWCIVIADIEGSTKAISEGRYKDVNMVGAACIASALNALKALPSPPDIPYVFGGDGATLAMPGGVVDIVRQALTQTKRLSESQFGLALRIGIVPEKDAREHGGEVLVAKYRLSSGNYLALFNGGGVGMVDALVKGEDTGAKYRVDAPEDGDRPDLEGLSCRWHPLRSQRGKMVSLLIMAPECGTAERTGIYRDAEARIRDAIGGELAETASPTSDAHLRFGWPPPALMTEVRSTAPPGAIGFVSTLLFVALQSAVQWWLHKTGGNAGGYDAPAYKRELIANSDFRRFDDMLRLLLDCSGGQIEALERCLAGLRAERGVAYGLHISDTALMTCLVFSLEDSEHVHFLDGGDGGFAIAAKQLKAQLSGAA